MSTRSRNGFRMRGGLAHPPAGEAPRLPPPAAPGASPGAPPGGAAPRRMGPGDWLVEMRASFARNQWTLTYVGFLIYIFVITTYRIRIGDIGVGMALIGLLFHKELRVPPLAVLFTVLTAWCGIGYFQSNYQQEVAKELDTLWKLALIIIAAVNALRTRAQIRIFVLWWLACFAAFPVRGTYVNYFIAGYKVFGRAVWGYIYSNPNDLAALTLLQLALCVGVLVMEPKRSIFRKAALIGVPILVLQIVLTQSRAGFLGLAVFGLFAMGGARQRMRSILLLGLVGSVVMLFAPNSFWKRMKGMANLSTDTEELRKVDKEGSAEQRFNIWRVAVRIIGDNPVFGVGWGAYELANATYAGRKSGADIELGARDTHSTYLNLTAETGFPGLLLFGAIVGTTMLHAERIRRRCKKRIPRAAQQLYLLELGMIAFLIAGVFGSYARLAHLYIYLALMYGMAAALDDEDRALRRLEQGPLLPEGPYPPSGAIGRAAPPALPAAR